MKKIDNKHIYKNRVFIIAIIASVIIFGSLVHSFVSDFLQVFDINKPFAGIVAKVWFNGIGYFTKQTNLLCLIVLLIFIFKPSLFFKKSKLVMSTTIYISITCLICWVVMAPVYAITKTANWMNPNTMISLGLLHIVVPFMFWAWIMLIFYDKHYHFIDNKVDLKFMLLVASIYPIVYIIYCLFINFIPMDSKLIYGYQVHNRDGSIYTETCYISIYGIITNFNPKCCLPTFDNGTWWHDASNQQGNPVMITIYIGFVLIIVGCILTWTLIFNHFQKHLH